MKLEPPYRPVCSPEEFQRLAPQAAWEPETDEGPQDRLRFKFWVSPQQDTRWELAEAFPRQLQGVGHRIGFEIIGNEQNVALWLTCHPDDGVVLQTAFESTFASCKLRLIGDDPLGELPLTDWSQARFQDFVAPSIYSRQLTQPEQLPLTPLAAVFQVMSNIPAPAVGLYQVLFQPVAWNWHSNIATLYDVQFLSRYINAYSVLRANLQVPSGDIRVLAEALNSKADNDRAIFALALRLAVVGAGDDAPRILRALDVFSGLIQHGGRPLERITEAAYRSLSPAQVRDMFRFGLTFRPGFLGNSAELTSFLMVSVPLLERHKKVSPLLETLSPAGDLSQGCYIGDCHCAGELQPICIPLTDRRNSVHVIGKPGKGKSELLKRLIRDDILRGEGLILIDPHRDLVDDLLDLIPPEHAERVILLRWSPEWIPLFNPMGNVDPADRGTLADNIVSSFKDVSEGWGHRAEHITRLLVHGLLHLPETSLLDASDALCDEAGETIRKRVAEVVEDPLLKRFWTKELRKYAPSDRAPVQHKLGLLLDIPPVSWMFMQTGSALNLRRAMAEQSIILVDLAGMGEDCQRTLGSLILSLLQVETLGRSRQARHERTSCNIVIDESHILQTQALEGILVQCRKYGIGVTLSHQYLRQYTAPQIDALETVGSTIIFNLDSSDAKRLCNSLQEKVSSTDIISLPPYEAIARIQTEIIHMHTLKVPQPEHPSCRQQIIDRSHQRYYKPASVVLAEINRRARRWEQPFSPLTQAAGSKEARVTEHRYDEW